MPKKSLILFFCLAIAIAWFLTALFRSSPQTEPFAPPAPESERKKTLFSNPGVQDVRAEWEAPALEETPSRPPPSDASPQNAAEDEAAGESPPVTRHDEITVHLLSDFAEGDLSNVIANGVLRMGDGAEFTPRGAPPDQKFGIYVSPQQEAAEAFDELIAESEAVIPDGGELAFEFRTRTASGNWSVWQRIEANEMSRPVALDRPAKEWQYRLTFLASDPSLSPEVHSVAFVTRSAGSNEPPGDLFHHTQTQNPDENQTQ